jgi:hypothetical protein
MCSRKNFLKKLYFPVFSECKHRKNTNLPYRLVKRKEIFVKFA